jgi:leader peptidase (prepilin peptidase)/N-methyltransferase
MSDTLYLGLAFILGACVGSFLNVCVSRWPRELSVISPPSRCPKCARPIRAFENVPILGWLMLRGRCRGCNLPIAVTYPAVELTVALGWLGAVALFGPTLVALRVAVFGTVMLGIALTDLAHYLLPDGVTVFGLLWLLATALAGHAVGEQGPFASFPAAVIGACAGAGGIAIVGWLGEVALKKEAMGFGDVTLMAVVGAALGAERALLTVFVGALIATITFLGVVYPVARIRWRARSVAGGAGGGDQLGLPLGVAAASEFELPHVPFGVFLAPAALVTLLVGNPAIAWYLQRL